MVPTWFSRDNSSHARSRFVLSDFPLNRAAASKKKEFVWTDDEAELLLAVTHDCKIKRLVEGTRDYRQK